MNLLQGAKDYKRDNVRGSYDLLRVNKGDNHKLSCRTSHRWFNATVMQCRTMNAPEDVWGSINKTNGEDMADLASGSMDNIVSSSNLEEEHDPQNVIPPRSHTQTSQPLL